MVSRIAAVLTACANQGSFAVERACAADDLVLAVKRVGPILFPISPEIARKLIERARPAPFGRHSKTLHDKRVRDTWELGAGELRIDTRRFLRTLTPQLAAIQKDLGLPEAGRLCAKLDKMLIYEPGQFFAPHQDSERDDHMVGSLVVALPSASEGGAVIVEHAGERRVFCGAPGSPEALSLLAFYADCHHEVKPITSGYRIVLTFHLLYQNAQGEAELTRAPQPPGELVGCLTKALDAHFKTPITKPDSGRPEAPPDLLVYLLDHQYTEKSLQWSRLKRMDRTRALAFREVAERLDCEIFLTLADVHESWSCEDETDDRYGYRYRRWSSEEDEEDEDDDGADDNGEGYTLIERFDLDIELRHWLDTNGQAVEGIAFSPGEDEICSTVDSDEMKPYHSEHEGYTGNAGNTVDRWYHRAAVVLWPRKQRFAIRAKVSPAWAVEELVALLAEGSKPEAHAKASALLPFWEGVVRREQAAGFVVNLLAVLTSLGDDKLASGLLAPLGPVQVFTAEAAPRFAELVEQHAVPWAKALVETWDKHTPSWNPPRWRMLLPGLCEALLRGAPTHGHDLAVWLLGREVDDFKRVHLRLHDHPPWVSEFAAQEEMHLYRGELQGLLQTMAMLDTPRLREELLGFLTAPNTALPLPSIAELLQEWSKDRPTGRLLPAGAATLYRYVVAGLAEAIAAPVRAPDDWSIEQPAGCACTLCQTFGEFLRASDQIELRWPLAKDKRQHIHQRIDHYRLPVAHETSRHGSPYTLVLRKQKALFEQDAALRAKEKSLLAWLKKHPPGNRNAAQ